MIFRTINFCTMTMTLLLGAGYSPEAISAAAAEVKRGEAPASAVASERKTDIWKVVGPLVAGSYTGSCLRTPDGRKGDATITVRADGTASWGELRVDLHAAKVTKLNRARDDRGKFTTKATIAVDDKQSAKLTLLSGVDGKNDDATLARGATSLSCRNVAGGAALNARPLYITMALPLEGKKQTIVCNDPRSPMLMPRDVDVAGANGVIQIGKTAFDMKTAYNEAYVVEHGGSSLLLTATLPAKREISIKYDSAGKVLSVTAMEKNALTYSCTRKG